MRSIFIVELHFLILLLNLFTSHFVNWCVALEKGILKMGAIVFWTLIRTAILIPTLLILFEWLDYKFWWMITGMGVYVVIIHPMVIQYKIFTEQNKEIINNTLCSSCRHFDETAVLCMKHDKHPTVEFLPCEGTHWEVKEKHYEASKK